MNDSKIIDELGGTTCVAKMFEPPINPSSVSDWRKYGIPPARKQTLKLLHPNFFAGIDSGETKQTQGNA